MEYREFRIFLLALRQRCEYYVAFKRIDESGDGKIDLGEFTKALDMIEKWVGKIEDPAKEFARIDKKDKGEIEFDDFCDWSVSKDLDFDDDEDFAV